MYTVHVNMKESQVILLYDCDQKKKLLNKEDILH